MSARNDAVVKHEAMAAVEANRQTRQVKPVLAGSDEDLRARTRRVLSLVRKDVSVLVARLEEDADLLIGILDAWDAADAKREAAEMKREADYE